MIDHNIWVIGILFEACFGTVRVGISAYSDQSLKTLIGLQLHCQTFRQRQDSSYIQNNIKKIYPKIRQRNRLSMSDTIFHTDVPYFNTVLACQLQAFLIEHSIDCQKICITVTAAEAECCVDQLRCPRCFTLSSSKRSSLTPSSSIKVGSAKVRVLSVSSRSKAC